MRVMLRVRNGMKVRWIHARGQNRAYGVQKWLTIVSNFVPFCSKHVEPVQMSEDLVGVNVTCTYRACAQDTCTARSVCRRVSSFKPNEYTLIS